MNQIIEWSQGNPGAMMFLMSLLEVDDPTRSIIIVQKIEKSSIRGTDLCVLWSDLCDKDLAQVEKLCRNCPLEVLEDACGRQDYSGRELVKQYLED